MAYTEWISPTIILQEFLNKSGHEGQINEELILTACNEALDDIITGDNFKEYIVLLSLYNTKTKLPDNFVYPTQVAYRSDIPSNISSEELKRYIVKSINPYCETEVKIDTCETCKQIECCCEEKEWYPIEVNTNYIKLSKNPQLGSGYSKFMYGSVNEHQNDTSDTKTSSVSHYELMSSKVAHESKVHRDRLRQLYQSRNPFARSNKCPEFQLVRPTSNYFFNLTRRVQECNIPSYDTNLEYNIDNKILELNNIVGYRCGNCGTCNVARPNRTAPNDYASIGPCEFNYEPEKDGQVLVSYLGRRMDDNGFLLIPNEDYIIRAVRQYVIAWLAEREYSIKMDARTERYWKNMEAKASKLMIQARSRFRMPSYDQWEQFVENHWTKRIPYYNYKKHNNTSRPDQYRLPNESYVDTSSDWKSYCNGLYGISY